MNRAERRAAERQARRQGWGAGPAAAIIGRAYPPGAELRGYVIEDVIRQGATSIVYRATGPSGPAALKALYRDHRQVGEPLTPAVRATWEHWARGVFAHERAMLAGLDHPRIPRLLDAFEDRGAPVLVLGLVEGETLFDRLERRGPCGDAEAAGYGAAVAAILAYLHGRGVAHRDVRPANCIRDRDGAVHLVDFAYARPATPEYVREDVRTLGVMLFRLLTDRPTEAARPDAPELDDGPLAAIVRAALGGRFPDGVALAAALAAAVGALAPGRAVAR